MKSILPLPCHLYRSGFLHSQLHTHSC
jgi:hypothetical protein